MKQPPSPLEKIILEEEVRKYLVYLVGRIEADHLSEVVHVLQQFVIPEPRMQTERLQ